MYGTLLFQCLFLAEDYCWIIVAISVTIVTLLSIYEKESMPGVLANDAGIEVVVTRMLAVE